MAMASGLYGITLRDVLDPTQLAVDLVTDSIKAALVNNTETPDFDLDDFYADFSANEISGTGYTAEGAALASKTLVATAGVLTYDAADTAWTTATFSGVRGTILHDDTLTSGPLIVAVNFGSDFAVTAGTFTIVWNASGIFTVDYTP
jgi:hypothetical protein